MSDASPSSLAGRRRVGRVLAVTATALCLVILASVFVAPAGSASHLLTVTPSTGGSTSISVPHPGWVTVHFDHPAVAGMGMRYWVHGGSQMMVDRSMMQGSDAYSFWSWGGTYECGASFSGQSSMPMPAWVNVTWGPF